MLQECVCVPLCPPTGLTSTRSPWLLLLSVTSTYLGVTKQLVDEGQPHNWSFESESTPEAWKQNLVSIWRKSSFISLRLSHFCLCKLLELMIFRGYWFPDRLHGGKVALGTIYCHWSSSSMSAAPLCSHRFLLPTRLSTQLAAAEEVALWSSPAAGRLM